MSEARCGAVDLFVKTQTKKPERFSAIIDPADEMLLFDLPSFGGNRERAAIHYLSQGRVIRDNLNQILSWHFAGKGEIKRFLDFASGYGRLTRFMVQEITPDHIWISDIYREGVAFQQRQFGVGGIVSTPNPEQYPDSGKFDCIYVGSLFSHLPQKTFSSWLSKLYSMLNLGGLLAFSVLDFARIPAGTCRPSDGYSFSPSSESATLDHHQYGITHVNEEFVRGQIAQASAGAGHYLRIPRALAGHQDIYALSNAPLQPTDQLNFAHAPVGYLDRCEYNSTGAIVFAGWSADVTPGGSIREVQISVDGELACSAKTTQHRPDVAAHLGIAADTPCAWAALLPAGVPANALITVKIISARAFECVLLIETLADLMLRLLPNAIHHRERVEAKRQRV